MISAIITSYKEPVTIVRAIRALQKQLSSRDEIIVIAPDVETRNAASSCKKSNVSLRVLKDPGKGKPTALNIAVKSARGTLLLLTDGDVYVDERALKYLLPHLDSSNVGAATARVISSDSQKTMLGFWAYALTESFHHLRLWGSDKGIATGYLYLIRKSLFPTVPVETLADDAYVSYTLLEKEYTIAYEPRARVYVKYPQTLPDWLRQKKRTAGRVYQLSKRFHVSRIKSFTDELLNGARMITYVRSPKELTWLFALFGIKLYVWARVFFDVRLWKRAFNRAWERVETTK